MALANYNHVLFIYLCNQHSQYACWMSEIILDIIQARAGFMLMCMCDFFFRKTKKEGEEEKEEAFLYVYYFTLCRSDSLGNRI